MPIFPAQEPIWSALLSERAHCTSQPPLSVGETLDSTCSPGLGYRVWIEPEADHVANAAETKAITNTTDKPLVPLRSLPRRPSRMAAPNMLQFPRFHSNTPT